MGKGNGFKMFIVRVRHLRFIKMASVKKMEQETVYF